MRRSRPCRRVGIVVAAVSVSLFLGAAVASRAGVKDSRHDFTTVRGLNGQDLDKGGVCTPCHAAHFAPDDTTHGNPDLGIWVRDMSQESSYYEQNGTAGADYVPGATRLCYDCHDDNVSADSDPLNSIFTYPPQDIARGGSLVGYYENACGQLPEGTNPVPTDGSPTGGHYWKSVPSGTPGGGLPDYARGDKIACSLCHDPHNAATGTNEAFFRTTTWDGSAMKPLNDFNSYGTNLKASTYNATTLPNGSRNGTGNGRAMCAICHGYSDQGNQALLNNVTVPIPTAGVAEHVFDDTVGATACVACHGHNQIAGCNACHGYPPMLTEAEGEGTFNPNDPDKPNRRYVENYPGGAGAHRRHRDALAALGSSVFDCALCHGPEPGRPGTTWHNEGCNTDWGTAGGTNVDIMGQAAYWGTSGSPTPPGYNGVTTGGFTGPDSIVYAFAAKGGGAQRCSNLTCHGLPPNATNDEDALNWDDRMVYDTTDATAGTWVAPAGDSPKICKWCHDKSPARIGTGGVWAPNVLGDGDDDGTGAWTAAGTWGGDVSGHGKAAGNYDADAIGGGGGVAAANKQCTVCHDARYTTIVLPAQNAPFGGKTHFNGSYESSGSEKRLRDTINTIATANADAACGACHQNGATGAAEGTEVSTHGNDFAGNEEGPQGSMSRSCRQCHDVHGANWNGAGRNLHLVGKWLDSPLGGTRGAAEAGEEARVDSTAAGATTDITSADAKVIFTANSGADSYDDGFGGPSEDPALHESVCVVCHTDLVGNHNEAGSPEVLNEAGSHNPVGTDCMICHDHDYDNAALTADAFAPSGCNGCHGNAATNGQFWPDGLDNNGTSRVLYADDNAGQHQNHVESISRRVFGQTVAQLLLDPGTATKQKQICRYCHPDPGGGGHNADSGDSRADVFAATATGDYFGRYAPGAEPLPPAAPVEDDAGLAYDYGAVGEGTCNNLVCHNLAATPFWNALVDWTDPVPPTNCSNTTCHDAATYTNAHATHVGAAGKGYACTECHAANYNVADLRASLQHQDGDVDMVWTTAGSIEAAHGGDGFYDKNDPTYGDTGFAARSGVYNVACNLVYCHGGDNAAWGGGDIAPVWDDSEAAPGGVYCGSCHDGNGTVAPNGDASVTATGNHTDHLSAAHGPRFADPAGPAGPGATVAASCLGTATIGCHPNFLLATATHVDGSVEFANVDLTASVLADTDRCSSCHSTASVALNTVGTVVGADLARTKANWDNGAYELPCLTCHNGTDAATVFADGTGAVSAPDMLGTNAVDQSGAEIRGHNRASAGGEITDGAYPVSGNPAANQACTGCHSAAATHVNNSSDATYGGNRMLATINAIAVATRTEACNACHAQGAGASPATKKNVNTHGNSAGTYLEPAAFTVADCMQCHEPHGLTANGGGYNIQMINPTITVVPGSPGTTVAGVRFEGQTGAYSFNDLDAPTYTPENDVCAACHINASNPGTPMVFNSDGLHNTSFYTMDERGNDCSGCHNHNKDGSLASVDGFMPLSCDSCHTYPGLANLSAEHTLSQTHNIHVDSQANGGYNFPCTFCHFGYTSTHNQSGFPDGGTWDDTTVLPANIHIRFNPLRNPGTDLTYGGAGRDADQGTTGVAGHAGQCAGLYCHGNDTTLQSDWSGTAETPSWAPPPTNPPRYACSACHADPPASGAHGLHADAGDETDRTDCVLCHGAAAGYGAQANGTTDPANHVNGSTDITSVGYANQTTAIPPNGNCTAACHASAASPGDGFWTDTALDCTACHYYAAAPTGAENTAGRTISADSHNGHFDAAAVSGGRQVLCADCHEVPAAGNTAHITDSSGADDGARLTGRAQALLDEAAVSTTATPQWWTGGTWIPAPTRTCANQCHNPSADGSVSTAWGTTNALGCEFCHDSATAPPTGSHAAHVDGSATFGLTIGCTSCHPDNAAAEGHMTGTVELPNVAGAAPYSESLVPAWAASYGSCTTTTCHADGTGVAVTSPVWGTASADCTICHLAPPASGRHAAHDANTFYVADVCGACHAANANKTTMGGYATHIDGTVDIGGTATVDYPGAGDCTNDCHTVDAGAAGDWLDANPLACTDCHADTYIGGGANAPASGLHAVTSTVSGNPHDGDWDADGADGSEVAGCVTCHTAAPTDPETAHVDGTLDASVGSDDTTLPEVHLDGSVGFVDGATPTCGPSGGTYTTCHGPTANNGDAGTWDRRWDTSAANSDGTECANCHGTFVAGWTWDEAHATSTDHTNPYDQGSGDPDKMDQHAVCQTCHGWEYAGYDTSWAGTAPGHGDGSITMNGPTPDTGAEYDNATGGCTAACHLPGFVMNANSGWAANYGDFGAGTCETCHRPGGPGPNVMGNGTLPAGDPTHATPKPYDDGDWGFNVNGHGANGSADGTPKDDYGDAYLLGNAACTACHNIADPGSGDGRHNNGILSSVESGTNLSTNTAHLISEFFGTEVNDYDVQVNFDDTCYTKTGCHSAAMSHRHAKDAIPALKVVRFGDGSTVLDGQSIRYPIDTDLTTNADTGGRDYAPCISCHNPHGTPVDYVSQGKGTNRMLRDLWVTPDTLCVECHR